MSITDEGIELIPDNAIRYNYVCASANLNGAKNGDKVMASLEQDYRGDWAYASVKKVFGSGRTARVCADAIVEQYGIPHVFPQEVLDEAERVATSPSATKNTQSALTCAASRSSPSTVRTQRTSTTPSP